MATTGRAAIFFEGGRDFELGDLPIPEVEPDAALVRMTMANICGSDLHTWRGEFRSPAGVSPAGFVTGHEGCNTAFISSGRDSIASPFRERMVTLAYSALPLASTKWIESS